MKPIQLRLPPGTVQKGDLFWENDLEELDQDILEIDLPTGLTLAVGWYPECDPAGEFRITLFKEYWMNRVAERTARDIATVVDLVEGLAERFSGPVYMVPFAAHPVYASGALTLPSSDETRLHMQFAAEGRTDLNIMMAEIT